MNGVFEMDDLTEEVGKVVDQKLHPDVTVNRIMMLFEQHLVYSLEACSECYEMNQGHDEDCSKAIRTKPLIAVTGDAMERLLGGKK